MTLKELVLDLDRETIISKLFEIDDKLIPKKEEYQEILEYLKVLEPSEHSEYIIHIDPDEDFDEETDSYVVNANWFRVHGKKKIADDNWDGYWNLMSSPWCEWICFEIDSNLFNRFTEVEIVAWCLWEMTYLGFDEISIQNKANSRENN